MKDLKICKNCGHDIRSHWNDCKTQNCPTDCMVDFCDCKKFVECVESEQ